MVQIRRVVSLQRWYSSEDAKRSFGGICQFLNEKGGEVTLLGTPEEPLLLLRDADDVPEEPGDIEISIDDAKSDWSAVTTAAALLGARFRIQGKKVERAVLSKHPDGEHPAERYRRAPSADANAVAEQIEKLAKEVRKLGGKLNQLALPVSELHWIVQQLSESAGIINRRFREAWRLQNGYPVLPSATLQ